VSSAGDVIIVSGPPGSGKSTVSAALSAEAEKGVHLESDVFYRFITAGFVAPHTKPAHAQDTAVMDIAVDTAAQRVRERDRTSDVSGAEVMYDQMAGLGEFEAHVIDSERSIEEVLVDCRAALTSGRLLLGG
jgi:cytidylate kinase